jgi:hypothetical protein
MRVADMRADLPWYFLSQKGRISRQEYWLGYGLAAAGAAALVSAAAGAASVFWSVMVVILCDDSWSRVVRAARWYRGEAAEPDKLERVGLRIRNARRLRLVVRGLAHCATSDAPVG